MAGGWRNSTWLRRRLRRSRPRRHFCTRPYVRLWRIGIPRLVAGWLWVPLCPSPLRDGRKILKCRPSFSEGRIAISKFLRISRPSMLGYGPQPEFDSSAAYTLAFNSWCPLVSFSSLVVPKLRYTSVVVHAIPTEPSMLGIITRSPDSPRPISFAWLGDRIVIGRTSIYQEREFCVTPNPPKDGV